MSEKTTIKIIGIGEVGKKFVERGASSLCCADHRILSSDASKEMADEAVRGADMLWIAADAADSKLAAEVGSAAGGALTIALMKGAPDPDITASIESAVDAYTFVSGDDELDEAYAATSAFSQLAGGSETVSMDLDDLKVIFHRAGEISIGVGEGKDAADAARAALGSMRPHEDRARAERVLCCINADPDVCLDDIRKATEIISDASDPDATMLWGHIGDPDMHGRVKIALAVGFKSFPTSC